MDILLTKENWKFSYRVAGLAVKDGSLLVQQAARDEGYALPGGHVAFGETTAQALAREFQEELQLDVAVGALAAVGEVFWDWHGPCQQLGLYYWVDIPVRPWAGPRPALDGNGSPRAGLSFSWVPVEAFTAGRLRLYPGEATACLQEPGRIHHFVSKQL